MQCCADAAKKLNSSNNFGVLFIPTSDGRPVQFKAENSKTLDGDELKKLPALRKEQ